MGNFHSIIISYSKMSFQENDNEKIKIKKWDFLDFLLSVYKHPTHKKKEVIFSIFFNRTFQFNFLYKRILPYLPHKYNFLFSRFPHHKYCQLMLIFILVFLKLFVIVIYVAKNRLLLFFYILYIIISVTTLFLTDDACSEKLKNLFKTQGSQHREC